MGKGCYEEAVSKKRKNSKTSADIWRNWKIVKYIRLYFVSNLSVVGPTGFVRIV